MIIDSSAIEGLIKLAEVVMIPFAIYVVRSVSQINERVRTVETVLIGADGKNGIRSRLRRVESSLMQLSLAQAASSHKSLDIDVDHGDEE